MTIVGVLQIAVCKTEMVSRPVVHTVRRYRALADEVSGGQIARAASGVCPGTADGRVPSLRAGADGKQRGVEGAAPYYGVTSKP